MQCLIRSKHVFAFNFASVHKRNLCHSLSNKQETGQKVKIKFSFRVLLTIIYFVVYFKRTLFQRTFPLWKVQLLWYFCRIFHPLTHVGLRCCRSPRDTAMIAMSFIIVVSSLTLVVGSLMLDNMKLMFMPSAIRAALISSSFVLQSFSRMNDIAYV